MKNLVLAAIVAVIFAAGFQTYAATLTNLPIGSVEKVLNHKLMNTWQITVIGRAITDPYRSKSFSFGQLWRSYTNDDGTTESINALCRRAASTGDKTEFKAILQKMMRESVRVLANTNDLTLQGKILQVVVYGEWLPNPEITENLGTFTVINEFVLNGVIPENAYDTDMDKAIQILFYQTLFVDGVVRGEVKDAQGNIIDRAMVFGYQVIGHGAIGLGNEVLIGQAGTVQLWYRDKTTQTFSLANGSLIPNPPPVLGALRVGIEKHNIQNPMITVFDPPESVTVEWSEDLKVWKNLIIITNTANSYGRVVVGDTSTAPARFYRAHIGK